MRTFAMSLATAGVGIIVAILAYFMFAIILPAIAKDPSSGSAAAVPIFGAIIVVFAALALASFFWAGARRRSWFWILDVVAGALILLLVAPGIVFSLSHPNDAQSFMSTVLGVLGAGLAIVGGVGAFLDVRRGAPRWTRSGRAGQVMTALVALVAGALVTSALAGNASAGAGVAEAPTVTGVETAQNVKFVETSLSMKNGEVLGLFVINKDDFAHTFDIDQLNIHATLPPHSTTAVAIKPTAAGTLQFYCAVPGHRDGGMAGTLTVAQ